MTGLRFGGANKPRRTFFCSRVLLSCCLVLCAPVTSVVAGDAAQSDLQAGLEAYDGGRLKEAVTHFRRAADCGDQEALVVLAGLTLEGSGLPADPAEAARLYRLAAEAGHPVAQLNLGELYSRGRGVERDLVQAHLWLSRAAAQGRQWPRQRLVQIERFMTPGELAKARAAAGEP